MTGLRQEEADGTLVSRCRAKEDLLGFLHDIADHVGYLGKEIVEYFLPGEEREKPTAASARAAAKVFGLPEMCEKIVLLLNIKDVLALMQVHSDIFETVQCSSRIQRHLFLKPDPGAHFRTPLGDPTNVTFPPLTCRLEARSSGRAKGPPGGPDRPVIELAIHYQQDLAKYQKAGARCRSMLVCQPPVHRLTVLVRCCYGKAPTDVTPGWMPEAVESETGITIGHVLDTAKSLIAKHRNCPYAGADSHSEFGVVEVWPRFEATVNLRDDDPKVLRYGERKAARKQSRVEAKAWEARVAAYASAKLQAHEIGQPIPTLEEFETMPSAPAG